MFGKSLKLFRIFGFEVRVDASWAILAILITWSLAQGLFSYYYKGFSATIYWVMAVCGAIGLFISIIVHELCHSLVAKKFGLRIAGITLFVFGGVAQTEGEPSSPKTELFMATAGPVSSFVLGAIFFLVAKIGIRNDWTVPVTGVASYLAYINWVLAGFNLLPGFPLDGGRILRALLWQGKKDLHWATRIASQIGAGFGILMIIVGVFQFFSGNFIGGVWIGLIGMFLHNASRASFRQLLIKEVLGGEHARRFMKSEPITVPPMISVRELVDGFIYKYHYKMFPVVEAGKLKGCVTTRQVKEIPAREWPDRKVGDIVQPCSGENTIGAETDIMKALALMNRTGNSRLLVVEKDELVGILALKDILKFLSMKLYLEDNKK